MILKKYSVPTDIFIVGVAIEREDEWTYDFSITDDESYFTVIQDNKIKYYNCCDGSVSILNKDEFYKFRDSFSEDLIDLDFLYISNFSGEIGVKVVHKMKDKDNVHIETFDINKELMYIDSEESKSAEHDKDYDGSLYCISFPVDVDILLGKYDEDLDKWLIKKWIEV